jgi:3-dehydroquinate synthetase
VPGPFADPRSLWELATKDKKVRHGRVPMVVPAAIGEGVVVELTPERLAHAFA